MNKNFILGSGLAGLIAKFIFPTYTIIPFGRSRFYSPKVTLGDISIPIGDNNIVRNEKADEVIKDMGFEPTYEYYPTAISYSGELTFNKRVWSQVVVDKLYGDNPHPFANKLLADDFSSYHLRADTLYNSLLNKFLNSITAMKDSKVDRITDGEIIFDSGARSEYNNIISTIPLYALLGLMGISNNLESADCHVHLMATRSFNLEGARRCFIGDLTIPFWKVNVINQEIYQFYAKGEVEGAEAIFELLTNGSFKKLADTMVNKALPLGPPPTDILEDLRVKNILCVGQLARWDYFADITTSIIDLLRT